MEKLSDLEENLLDQGFKLIGDVPLLYDALLLPAGEIWEDCNQDPYENRIYFGGYSIKRSSPKTEPEIIKEIRLMFNTGKWHDRQERQKSDFIKKMMQSGASLESIDFLDKNSPIPKEPPYELRVVSLDKDRSRVYIKENL